MDQFDLSGHVSVVTGGNRGIGLGIARGLAKAGARVAIWSRAVDRNEAAVAEIEALGGEALAVTCDVADEASVIAAMEQTMAAFGHVDSLFANAGTSGMGKFPADFDLDEWHRVMDVNLTGVFLTTRIVADHLVERGEGGSIVLTGSVVARLALPLAPHYTASKGAVLSLGRSLANRLGRRGIRVNVLSPGWVETEMAEGVIADERSASYFMSRIPLRRWGAAEDFEGPAVFLASDASRYMTGAELVIDGGISSS
ncbi:MAG: glucose 1-dehydrogenase [Acidimicrobiia bacterium]|nr:glucose 1-dehydrogenase [Acidimicrobiia bacterium]MBT8194021.1 glucose 1-dehydrogenase [Acidimicrobiia bacterium]NNF88534.1 glucose 1-dehydrogenase [Acidimicrobiia bacterium]NNL14422.1 glucose 1-dehydrogenase [Acidimicrobiia bacterium]